MTVEGRRGHAQAGEVAVGIAETRQGKGMTLS
jgi:hypothetical protein